ncbi:uncharacterized protein LOC135198597 [Macrobrachium nipponense]|uniref:uncharacterized protein LOC135198597 n=1 Tax=Macrobrachium nipponense TaxID=159736 RepID=UPI0030C8A8DD
MLGAVFFLLLIFISVWGDLLKGVDVPLYAFAGGQATLSCSFDLQARKLYSLKWYHNGTEFYRYVPTERKAPINIKPSHTFYVTERFRNDMRVTLSLTRLNVSASGHYRCEVIAEHPSFTTDAATASMTVLEEPLRPPTLVGEREIYEPSEMIKVGCQTQRPHQQALEAKLQWFLDGNQVDNEWVTPYGGGTSQTRYGVSLHVPGEQIYAMGGAVKAECRLTLGPLEVSSSKTLQVRTRITRFWTITTLRMEKCSFQQQGVTSSCLYC